MRHNQYLQFFPVCLLLAAALVHAQPTEFRTRIKVLARQLVTPSESVECEGFGPTTDRDGLNNCILHIRSVIRNQTVLMLNNGDSPEQILGELNQAWGGEQPTFFVLSDNLISPLVVIGYALPVGGSALPGRRVALEGFKREAGVYAAVSENGGSEMNNYMLRLDDLGPVRAGHVVFLMSGRNCCSARQLQKPEIWDFDGGEFLRLWKADRPLDGASYEIFAGGRLEVLYMDVDGKLAGSSGPGTLRTFHLRIDFDGIRMSEEVQNKGMSSRFSPGEVRRTGSLKN